MSVARSKKGKCTEDEIARDPVRGNNYPAIPDRILYQDLVVYSSGKPGHKFSIGKTPVHERVPPDIPQPSAGKNPDLSRKSEFFGKRFLLYGPMPLSRLPSSLHRLRQVQGKTDGHQKSREGRHAQDGCTPKAVFRAERVVFAGSVPRIAASIRPAARSFARVKPGSGLSPNHNFREGR